MKKGWKLAVFGIVALIAAAIFTVPVGAAPEITSVNIQDSNSDGLYEPFEQITVTITAEDALGVDKIELSHLDGTMWSKNCGGVNTCTFEQVLTHSKVGVHNYTAIAYDVNGDIDTNEFSITIRENKAPVAKIEVEEEWGYAPFEVKFDCRDSYDDGEIVAYVLNFGDGEIETGNDISKLRVRHDYEDIGTYNVTLTVVDNLDVADQVTMQISVGRYAEFDHTIVEEKDDVEFFADASDGDLYISDRQVELDSGAKVVIPINVINLGKDISEYSLAVGYSAFGDAHVTPANFKLGYLENMSGYVTINADDAASGEYALSVNLLANGEVVDSEKIFITVVGAEPMNFTLFALIGLLIVAMAGVIGLVCMICLNFKKKELVS